MLSIVHITARGLHCFADAPEKNLSQYNVLAQAISSQAIETKYELICVDQVNAIPAKELVFALGSRVKFVRPRQTPWKRIGAFCAASARNTGLTIARGHGVFFLDDCHTFFHAHALEKASYWCDEGCVVLPIIHNRSGECMDGRLSKFGIILEPDDILPQILDRPETVMLSGIMAAPMDAILRANGYDEHFDGCKAFEDMDFLARIVRIGCPVVLDPIVSVCRHNHLDYDHTVMKKREQRCARATWEISKKNPVKANVTPYSEEALNSILRCSWYHDNFCSLTGVACDSIHEVSHEAERIMRDYENSPLR